MIRALAMLGDALGYTVVPEFEVQPEGACVDVAYLRESGQKFPLMIFEVESRASGGMLNNAAKVLSQPVDQFFKPLFFFHVVLSGGPQNPRLENLSRLFGSHNYRTYPLPDGDATRLAVDILWQHRRIHSKVNLAAVLQVLTSSEWAEVSL